MAESVEEFDKWLDAHAPPTSVSVAASRAAAPAASDSGWFSSLGFSSTAAAPSSAPPSLGGLFSSVTSVVPSAAMAKFDGLLDSAAPATSVFSSAFGGVADSLKAKYEESVEQYQREQARYCTEEAQRAERQQLAESLKHVQVGLAVLSGTAAAPSSATAPVEDPVA